jgi:hypothetical protein
MSDLDQSFLSFDYQFALGGAASHVRSSVLEISTFSDRSSLACLWNVLENRIPGLDSFDQVWQVPGNRLQGGSEIWVVAATAGEHKLKTKALESGELIQEGSSVYFEYVLKSMARSENQAAQQAASRVIGALKMSQVQYVHLHVALLPETGMIDSVEQREFILPTALSIELPHPIDQVSTDQAEPVVLEQLLEPELDISAQLEEILEIPEPLTEESFEAIDQNDSEPSLENDVALQEKAEEFKQQFSLPGFLLHYRFNPYLGADIKTHVVRDRNGNVQNIFLECGISASEEELHECFNRAGNYQELRSLAFHLNLRRVQVQEWFNKYKKAPSDTIAAHTKTTLEALHQGVLERIEVLANQGLDNIPIADFDAELTELRQQYFEHKNNVDRMHRSANFGFLHRDVLNDGRAFKQEHLKTIKQFLSDSAIAASSSERLQQLLKKMSDRQTDGGFDLDAAYEQFADFYYFIRHDSCFQLRCHQTDLAPELELQQLENGEYCLKELSRRVLYRSSYLKQADGTDVIKRVPLPNAAQFLDYGRKLPTPRAPFKLLNSTDLQQLAQQSAEYVIVRSLYPNCAVFIGPAAQKLRPRLELLWGGVDLDSTDWDIGFSQIWRLIPALKTDQPLWLVVAATIGTQSLTVKAAAEEGTWHYLNHRLEEMQQSQDDYLEALASLLQSAIADGQIRYLHIHQDRSDVDNVLGEIVQ